MPSGKCEDCGIRWSWLGRPRMSEAMCPACQRPLKATSQNSLLPQLDAYAVSFANGPKYLTANPTEVSKLRRKLSRNKHA